MTIYAIYEFYERKRPFPKKREKHDSYTIVKVFTSRSILRCKLNCCNFVYFYLFIYLLICLFIYLIIYLFIYISLSPYSEK